MYQVNLDTTVIGGKFPESVAGNLNNYLELQRMAVKTNTAERVEPNESEPNNLAKSEHTANLLGLAIEVHKGVMTVSGRTVAGPNAILAVTFTLGAKAPTTQGLIVNGELFVSALDASGLGVRERQRLLAVARRCATNG